MANIGEMEKQLLFLETELAGLKRFLEEAKEIAIDVNRAVVDVNRVIADIQLITEKTNVFICNYYNRVRMSRAEDHEVEYGPYLTVYGEK